MFPNKPLNPGLFVLGIMLGSAASAYDRAVDIKVSASGFANDNYNLAEDSDVEETFGMNQDIRLGVSIATERDKLETGLNVYTDQLEGTNSDGSDHYDWYGLYENRFERSKLNVSLNYRDSNELADDEALDVLVQTRKIGRSRTLASGEYTYNITERFSLGTNLSLQRVKYEANNSSLYSYNYLVAGITPEYRITERLGFYTQLGASTVYYNDSEVRENFVNSGQSRAALPDGNVTQNLRAGLSYLFSPKMSGRLSMGRRSSEYDTINVLRLPLGFVAEKNSNEASGFTVDGQFSYRNERSVLDATLSSVVSPNGAGLVTEENTARVEYRLRFTEQLNFLTNISHTRRRSDQEGDSNLNQNLWRTTTRLTWKPLERWSFLAEYRYLARDLVDLDRKANSNLLRFGVVWTMLPYKW